MAYESKRWYSDPGAVGVMCNDCKHNHKALNQGALTCDAFPNGIPRELMLRGEHNTSYPGDHGIRYEPKEE